MHPSKLKLNSYCNCFWIVRANKKCLSIFGAGGFSSGTWWFQRDVLGSLNTFILSKKNPDWNGGLKLWWMKFLTSITSITSITVSLDNPHFSVDLCFFCHSQWIAAGEC